jgi:hypothetical protein
LTEVFLPLGQVGVAFGHVRSRIEEDSSLPLRSTARWPASNRPGPRSDTRSAGRAHQEAEAST